MHPITYVIFDFERYGIPLLLVTGSNVFTLFTGWRSVSRGGEANQAWQALENPFPLIVYAGLCFFSFFVSLV